MLAGLPFNDTVINRIFIQEIENIEINEETNKNKEDNNINKSTIPNFVADTSKLDILYQHLANHISSLPISFQPYIELPNIRNTLFNEFNRSQPLFSLAFPRLYPEGQGEFVQIYQRTIKYIEYI